jgi:enolase-phosphatase E1
LTATGIRAPAAVIVDIEGTVGSIRFVKDVLFPYARSRLRPFILANQAQPDVARQLEAIGSETGIADIDGQIAQLERWSDADRKVTPLKALQGMVWAGGYASGELVAHLYDDAIAALQRWAVARMPVYVYSSGSIAAQKLYFAHSRGGDLTAGLAGYFDTTTGPKQDAGSYRRIASTTGRRAAELLFLSDVAAELKAAAEAGLQAVQVRREPPVDGPFEPSIVTFDQLPI